MQRITISPFILELHLSSSTASIPFHPLNAIYLKNIHWYPNGSFSQRGCLISPRNTSIRCFRIFLIKKFTWNIQNRQFSENCSFFQSYKNLLAIITDYFECSTFHYIHFLKIYNSVQMHIAIGISRGRLLKHTKIVDVTIMIYGCILISFKYSPTSIRKCCVISEHWLVSVFHFFHRLPPELDYKRQSTRKTQLDFNSYPMRKIQNFSSRFFCFIM